MKGLCWDGQTWGHEGRLGGRGGMGGIGIWIQIGIPDLGGSAIRQLSTMLSMKRLGSV